MKKQPEKTLATKNRIADAFFVLLEEKPINKIRIIDITEKATCNRSTFYEYFEDIYFVLEYGEQRIINAVREAAKQELNTDRKMMIETIAKIYIENGRNICILLGENGDPRFLAKFKETLYSEFLQRRHVQDNTKAELVYEYALTGLIMAFRWWYLNQDKCTIEEFITTMQATIMTGVINTLK